MPIFQKKEWACKFFSIHHFVVNQKRKKKQPSFMGIENKELYSTFKNLVIA